MNVRFPAAPAPSTLGNGYDVKSLSLGIHLLIVLGPVATTSDIENYEVTWVFKSIWSEVNETVVAL